MTERSAERRSLPEEDVRRLESFVDRHGFLSWLDLSVVELSEGYAVLSIGHDGKLTNPDGGVEPVHGGVTAALVDTAGGFALRTTFDDPPNAALTTTDLNVSYLRPATGDLTAVADVVRAGGTTGVVSVRVTGATPSGDDEEIAVGRTTYRLFRDADEEGDR